MVWDRFRCSRRQYHNVSGTYIAWCYKPVFWLSSGYSSCWCPVTTGFRSTDEGRLARTADTIQIGPWLRRHSSWWCWAYHVMPWIWKMITETFRVQKDLWLCTKDRFSALFRQFMNVCWRICLQGELFPILFDVQCGQTSPEFDSELPVLSTFNFRFSQGRARYSSLETFQLSTINEYMIIWRHLVAGFWQYECPATI